MPKLKLTKRVIDGLPVTGARYTATDTEIAGFCVRVSARGQKVYGFRYRAGGGRNGRDRWFKIGTHGQITVDQARSVARELAVETARGGDPAATRTEKRNAPTVSEMLDRYLDEHVSKKNKASTARNAKLLCENLIRPNLGKLKAVDVTTSDVAKFHAANAGTPYQANRALAALSKAFELAEIWGLRPESSNPCKKVERFKEQARERYLTTAEFKRLGQVLNDAKRGPVSYREMYGSESPRLVNRQAVYAIQLLIFTGARVGEVLSLQWEWIDFASGRANLPDSKTGKKTLQLPHPALNVLQEIQANCGAVNCNGYVIRGGDGTDPDRPLVNIKDPWAILRRAAGLDDVRIHDLRHAFASVAVSGGLSLPLIGSLLGHRQPSTTQRYAHLSDDPQRQAANQVAAAIDAAMAGGADVLNEDTDA